jgi:hypothetical protein
VIGLLEYGGRALAGERLKRQNGVKNDTADIFTPEKRHEPWRKDLGDGREGDQCPEVAFDCSHVHH